MENTSELNIQKQIYNLIVKEPGLHLNKIAQLLNVDRPLVIYHLHYLEKHELIQCDKADGYTRCFPKDSIGVDEKKKLVLFRKVVPLKITLYVLQHPLARHKEILAQFDISKSTLSYHLQKLMAHRIIKLESTGDDQGYLVMNPDDIIRILIKYKPSRIAFGVEDTWSDFSIYTKKEK